jgi:predicted dehydrogenase
LNRRELLGGTSAVLMATGVRSAFGSGFESGLLDAAGKQAGGAGAGRLRVGVIGPGSRGKELTRQLLHVPGVEIAAVCDVYEPRFAEVNQLVGHPVPGTKDYRELIDRKDLDVIYVATPIAFHAEHVLAGLRSGRPVYGEKAMAFTPEQCQEILHEASQPGRMYQVGHQYRYAPWVQDALKRVWAGAIGEPTHVYAYWHRNSDWRRPVPDPSLEHLINWRLYRESSGGLVTELGSHHIDIANWVFGAQPTRVLGTTSIVQYHDGRTVGDNVQAVFNYPNGRRLFFSALTDNAKVGNELWIYGTEGSVQITIEDATMFYEPRKAKPLPGSYEVVEHGITTGASYSTKGEMPYRGPGERLPIKATEDPTLTACRAFIECVRTGQQPTANVRVGFASGVAAAMANRAVNAEEPQTVPQPA